jgi:2-polyprenyl-3-methyl-5-hydroxy-6-metoxy-1,4-benzoquinol methylase
VDQQRQTLIYFRRHADDWQRKAVNAEDEYSVIDARNAAVLATISEFKKPVRLLDVGCGAGQLVIDAARQGASSHGIDFASEMIAQCEKNKAAAGVDASFDCSSFFDFKVSGELYDVVSAQGFIEYVSIDAVEEFFARSAHLLRPGGAVVSGSPNRLYNVISMNRFTEIERELDILDLLISEAIALQAARSQKQAFDALARLERVDPQPQNHPDTGIGVSLRHQFSPAELVGRLRRHGFSPATLYPIHFHALAPTLRDEFPALHHEIAIVMQKLAPREQRLVPFCSSFVLDVRKHV